VPDSCTKVGVLGVGQCNSTNTNLTDPCCHGNQISACCDKSSASVKQSRATITLGFAMLSSFKRSAASVSVQLLGSNSSESDTAKSCAR